MPATPSIYVELGRIRHPNKVPPEAQVCRPCNLVRLRIPNMHFLITCPTFNNLRCKLFNECIITITPTSTLAKVPSYPSKQMTNLICDIFKA